jgi:transposase
MRRVTYLERRKPVHVASHALAVYGLPHRFVHLDSTTVSLQGEYATPAKDPQVIRSTHGYSKDQRRALKQVVVSLLCTYRSAISVWLEALSGNSADKTTFPRIIQAEVAQLQAATPPYFIADSALYSQDMLKALAAVRWLTRGPETIQEARALLQRLEPAALQPADQGGYRYREVDSQYGGVPQRWLVVFSPQAYAQEVAAFQQHIGRQQEQAETQFWQPTRPRGARWSAGFGS